MKKIAVLLAVVLVLGGWAAAPSVADHGGLAEARLNGTGSQGPAEAGASTVVSSSRGPVVIPAGPVDPAAAPAFDPGPVNAGASGEPAPAAPSTGAAAPSAEGATESVIGPDGRQQILDTTTYPERAVGQVIFNQGAGLFTCTGFLVDPNTVVTAGHCVHDGSGSPTGWSTNVVFTPGRDGGAAPFGSCGATNLFTSDGWFNSATESADWGAIQLNCRVGEITGWYGLTVGSDGALGAINSLLRGYPGDKPAGTMWTGGGGSSIGVVQPAQLFYEHDTEAGMSGGPVYSDTSDFPECGFCAVAVHANGVHGAPPHSTHNHGPRINDEAFNALVTILLDNNRIRPDNWIRRGLRGRWAGNNVYNLTGRRQRRLTRLRNGGQAIFLVRVQNDGNLTDRFRVSGTRGTRRFQVTYYNGNRNISRAVKRGTYRTAWLAPSRGTNLGVVIKERAARPGHRRVFSITSRSMNWSSVFTTLGPRDRVKAEVRRR